MSALAAPRTNRTKRVGGLDLPVAAGVKIWGGAKVTMLNGYAQPAAAAAGQVFAGTADETVDNTGGGAGAVTVHVVLPQEKSLVPMIGDPANLFAQAQMGSASAYILDDQTTTPVSAGHSLMGIPWTFSTANGVQTVWVEVTNG